MVDDPYETDFYAWTQHQAGLLRRLPAISNELDIEHIAEEIEDLGRRSPRRALAMYIRAFAQTRTFGAPRAGGPLAR
jgi:Domain of unknown function DUF29